MLQVLIEGEVIATPVLRTNTLGLPFTTSRLHARDSDGASVWCSVSAADDAGQVLANLAAGARVAVIGLAAVESWMRDGEPHAGLAVRASRVMPIDQHRRGRGAAVNHADDAACKAAP